MINGELFLRPLENPKIVLPLFDRNKPDLEEADYYELYTSYGLLNTIPVLVE